ncbi:MAG TPA: alkaline phosphatase family protein [Candidatus Acidoferrales bacterium]|nr:alkaline phosphatase family protein [Candidatus Acidoferrales bacterium]
MKPGALLTASLLCAIVGLSYATTTARADGDLNNVKHIIVVMQENHSFDNYFGALPYVPGGAYHAANPPGNPGSCPANDHQCVEGLRCHHDGPTGPLVCINKNRDDEGGFVKSFHEKTFCNGPDLDHGWVGVHFEGNLNHPNDTLLSMPNDGFVFQNDLTEQIDMAGAPDPDDTMGYYDQNDLPFYYDLAQSFAIDDHYFCSVLGQTFPNRSYLLAATSFGHLTTSEIVVFPFTGTNPYKPITGTLFDLLDADHVVWRDYFSDFPESLIFRTIASAFGHGNAQPLSQFFTDVAAGTLPPVSFVEAAYGVGALPENDEHPPTDIKLGQVYVSQVVNALRNSQSWKDTVLFFTYDEHGGYYDHMATPAAAQGGERTPDGIGPGQCADLSAPPGSEMLGGGMNCAISQALATQLCAAANPTDPFPFDCASFDQLGIRVPFIAVSPFSKPHYVSHTPGDHASLVAFIEKRFLSSAHLTLRDANASTLEDLFDFDNSPSLNTAVSQAPPASPATDCP